MTVIERVEQYVADYNSKSEKLNGRIVEIIQRLEEIEIEIHYIQAKSLPEAIEYRVLTGDNKEEMKLKKLEEKLETEKKALEEEQLVLEKIHKKFLYESDDNVRELYNLFREEKQLQEQLVYSRVMKAKRVYMDAIRKEALPLKKLAKLDITVQQIGYNAGRTSQVHSPVGPSKNSNVNLHLTPQDVITLFNS